METKKVKRCSITGGLFELNQFNKDNSTKDGLRTMCRYAEKGYTMKKRIRELEAKLSKINKPLFNITIDNFTDTELVNELRNREYKVVATKEIVETIEL